MSRLLEGAHVFDYFTKFDYGICPSKTIVGKINSVGEYNKLIPSPDTRVEIERAPGLEEIRVIKDDTGDYHVTADHAIAREVLKEIDEKTIELYKPDIMPYPDTFTNLKNVTFHRDIIRYDQDGDRLLPGIRRAGFLSTMEEWNAMQTDEMVGYEAEVFVGLENTKTGDVWWATDELKKEILKRRRQMEEEDEDGTEDPAEENESGEVKA